MFSKTRSCVGRGQVSANRLKNINSAFRVNGNLVFTITMQHNGSCFHNVVRQVSHHQLRLSSPLVLGKLAIKH